MASSLHRFDEWHEDYGDVIWWRFPIEEAPYVGSPITLGYQVSAALFDQFGDRVGKLEHFVGGWPFSESDEPNLFWQRIDAPQDPRENADG